MDGFQRSLKGPLQAVLPAPRAGMPPENQRENRNLGVRSPEITGPRLREDKRNVTSQGQVWPSECSGQ